MQCGLKSANKDAAGRLQWLTEAEVVVVELLLRLSDVDPVLGLDAERQVHQPLQPRDELAMLGGLLRHPLEALRLLVGHRTDLRRELLFSKFFCERPEAVFIVLALAITTKFFLDGFQLLAE